MFTYCFNNEFISICFISLLCILYFYDDERCKMNFPVRDNKVLLYCIVYCIVFSDMCVVAVRMRRQASPRSVSPASVSLSCGRTQTTSRTKEVSRHSVFPLLQPSRLFLCLCNVLFVIIFINNIY